MRRSWRGSSITVVAVLHTVFTLLVASGALLPPELLELAGGTAPLGRIRPGFGSAEPPDLPALAFFWSLAFGVGLATLGLLVRDVERRGERVPRTVGVLLLVGAAVGAALIPAGGFWLLLVPAFSLSRRG